MRFYTLSPNVPENPVLFPTMRPTFIKEGHEFVTRIEDCDVVLFDFHTRIADYNQSDIDFIIQNKPSIATFDEWDRGGMSLEFWPNPLTKQMGDILELSFSYRVKSTHFCRLLDKTKKYYTNVYPYEKPIHYEEQPVSADDLFNRPFDIVFIANDAPQRQHIKKILELNAKLKCKIILGAEKIPFDQWVAEHKKGKLFIKWSAGGYGCEKMHNLFSIAAMIKEDNDQLLAHPFTNSVNCVSLSSNPTRQELEYLRLVVGNKEELYKIYMGCYEHMKKYYTAEAIAKDILEKIIKHCA